MRSLISMLIRLAPIMLITLLLTGCGGGPSGTYEARSPDGQGAMTLDFKGGNKVMVSIEGFGSAVECTYAVDGDQVKITRPGEGESLVLTRKGSAYEANMFGDKLVFNKK